MIFRGKSSHSTEKTDSVSTKPPTPTKSSTSTKPPTPTKPSTQTPNHPIQKLNFTYPEKDNFYLVNEQSFDPIRERIHIVSNLLRTASYVGGLFTESWCKKFNLFIITVKQIVSNLSNITTIAYVNDEVISFVEKVDRQYFNSKHPLKITMKNLVIKLRSFQINLYGDSLLNAEQMTFYQNMLENNGAGFKKLSKTDLAEIGTSFAKGDEELNQVVELTSHQILKPKKEEEEFQEFCKCINTKDPKEIREVFDAHNEYLTKRLYDYNNKPESRDEIYDTDTIFHMYFQSAANILRRSYEVVVEKV